MQTCRLGFLRSRNFARPVVCLGIVVGFAIAFAFSPFSASERTAGASSTKEVDASSLNQKVLCGYQGWFRCPGDSSDEGWRHWSRNHARLDPETVTFEMWPDESELTADERFPAPGFFSDEGQTAHLFSSVHPRTVLRHFEWMRDYGVDGIFLQRFLVDLGTRSTDQVLTNVRAACTSTGRVYAICYDLSGAATDTIVKRLEADWDRISEDLMVIRDHRYMHHAGRPVVFVWGFYSNRFSAKTAHEIIDIFQTKSRKPVTLIGGCDWQWRSELDPEWARAFRRFDVISPWNVGNSSTVDGVQRASTHTWREDAAEAKRSRMSFLPVIYPGFGWSNLKGQGSRGQTLPRLRGDFYWQQFVTASELGFDMAYVAMFDEVDEGTAIFKVTNSPPKQAVFDTFEGLPTDWYLKLTGEGTRLLRGVRRRGIRPPAPAEF
jgi:hypothetical protein